MSGGAVEGQFDEFGAIAFRAREGFRDHSREDTEIFFADLSYTTDEGGIYNTGVSHIARFTVSATDPNFTDPSTEVTVITADQPFNDHNFELDRIQQSFRG